MASPAVAVLRSVAGGRCSVFMVTGCIGLTALAPERPTAIPVDVDSTETSSDALVLFLTPSGAAIAGATAAAGGMA